MKCNGARKWVEFLIVVKDAGMKRIVIELNEIFHFFCHVQIFAQLLSVFTQPFFKITYFLMNDFLIKFPSMH